MECFIVIIFNMAQSNRIVVKLFLIFIIHTIFNFYIIKRYESW
jgi:hypothetical protein